jgi:hypothetical protein
VKEAKRREITKIVKSISTAIFLPGENNNNILYIIYKILFKETLSIHFITSKKKCLPIVQQDVSSGSITKLDMDL